MNYAGSLTKRAQTCVRPFSPSAIQPQPCATHPRARERNLANGPPGRDAFKGQQALSEYTEHVKALWSWESRLAVRVGSGDPLHAAYARAVEHLNDAILPFSEVALGEPYDGERARDIGAARQAAVNAQVDFNDAAAQRVGLPSLPA
jgi:hypothetical protein